MKLLDRAGEKSQELLDRLPVRGPNVRANPATFVDRFDKVVISRRDPWQHRWSASLVHHPPAEWFAVDDPTYTGAPFL